LALRGPCDLRGMLIVILIFFIFISRFVARCRTGVVAGL